MEGYNNSGTTANKYSGTFLLVIKNNFKSHHNDYKTQRQSHFIGLMGRNLQVL